MTRATLAKRLDALEARRRPPVTIALVVIGDGPALWPDGTECRDLPEVVIGGNGWRR